MYIKEFFIKILDIIVMMNPVILGRNKFLKLVR